MTPNLLKDIVAMVYYNDKEEKESDALPRDQVVKNLIDFWRDKPDADDILAMLIEEPTRWQPQK